MKKVIFGMLLIVIAFSTACKKDVPVSPEPIIYTDSPPASLFAPGAPYGITYNCWVDNKSISAAKIQNYLCNYDYYSGTWYDCGNWFLLPVKKYWGIIDNVIYVSNTQDWHSISPNTFIQASDVVKRKSTGVGQICNGCPNPLGAPGMVSYVQ